MAEIKVGVASCAHWAWLESSKFMVDYWARAIGYGAKGYLHVPVDAKGLEYCLSRSDYFIVHTHGTPNAFFDYRTDHKQAVIATKEEIDRFPRFPNLKCVFITACQAGGKTEGDNIASVLSRHIAADGLVFANIHVVWGSDYDFGEKNRTPGWVAYQNGRRVLGEFDIPVTITAKDAYEIYLEYSKTH